MNMITYSFLKSFEYMVISTDEIKKLKDTIEYKEFNFKIIDCPVCGHKTLDSMYICPNCHNEYIKRR